MPKTLLFVGEDRDTLAALAFVPGRLARASTIPDARRLLLRPDEDHRGEDYLIAYGPDVAALYAGHGDGPDIPLGWAWGEPIILLPAAAADLDWGKAAQRLGVRNSLARVMQLPYAWAWLCAALAAGSAKRGMR